MSGAILTIDTTDDEIGPYLRELSERMDDLTPVMKTIGETIRASVIRNFEKGGRPDKWAEHGDLTKKRRGDGAKVLLDEGFGAGLAGSITVYADKDSVKIGTNRVYAAVHQLGAKKGEFGTVEAKVKAHVRKIKSRDIKKGRKKVASGVAFVSAHTRKMELPWGDIPARPFLMVQKEDRVEIIEIVKEFLAEVKK